MTQKKHTRNQNKVQFAVYMLVCLGFILAGLYMTYKAHGIGDWKLPAMIVGGALTARLSWIGGRFSVHWD